MGGAVGGPEGRLAGQGEAVAAIRALGLFHPVREAPDALFVRQRAQCVPCERHLDAHRLLVFAHQQGVPAGRRFPCDRARRIAGTITAQVVDIVAGRIQAGVLAGVAAGILCVIVCLDSLGNAGISPADILGMRGTMEKLPTWSADWLDFFDCIAEGILMPLGALLMSIMYGWEIGPEVVHAEATREGQSFGAYGWFKICIKYITPLCMLLVLYGQIKEFFFV